MSDATQTPTSPDQDASAPPEGGGGGGLSPGSSRGLTLSGRDHGDFSVSGSAATFTNGSTIQMVCRMDIAPVSTKNVKRLVTTAQFSCGSTTLEISDSQFTGTYKRPS